MSSGRRLRFLDLLIAGFVGSASAIYIWKPSLEEAKMKRQLQKVAETGVRPDEAVSGARAGDGGPAPSNPGFLHDRDSLDESKRR